MHFGTSTLQNIFQIHKEIVQFYKDTATILKHTQNFRHFPHKDTYTDSTTQLVMMQGLACKSLPKLGFLKHFCLPSPCPKPVWLISSTHPNLPHSHPTLMKPYLARPPNLIVTSMAR